jgi:tight adherence protein C
MSLELLAAIVAFCTAFVLVLAFSGGTASVRTRLEALTRGQTHAPSSPSRPSLTERMVHPFAEGVVSGLKNVLPVHMLDGMRQQLILAGEPMTLNAFLTLRLIVFGVFAFLPIFLVISFGAKLTMMPILFIVAFGVAGVMLPQIWLRQRVGQRQSVIIRSLPDSFDLITTCVEAGLGLDAALARVSEKVEGPFADELHRALRDIGLGKSRRDALKELGSRTGVPDLITFVNAVIQAEQMGTSVGTVLRVQAAQLRVRRRQRAEEQAYKAPVKMIFPLVLCIFPSLFIVILGPAVITLMNGFPTD